MRVAAVSMIACSKMQSARHETKSARFAKVAPEILTLPSLQNRSLALRASSSIPPVHPHRGALIERDAAFLHHARHMPVC